MQEYFTVKLELDELTEMKNKLQNKQSKLNDVIKVKYKKYIELECEYLSSLCTHEIEYNGNTFLVNPDEVIDGVKLSIHWTTSYSHTNQGMPICNERTRERDTLIYMNLRYSPVREENRFLRTFPSFKYIVAKDLKMVNVWVYPNYNDGYSSDYSTRFHGEAKPVEIRICSLYLEHLSQLDVYGKNMFGTVSEPYRVESKIRGDGSKEHPLLINNFSKFRHSHLSDSAKLDHVSAGGRLLKGGVSGQTYFQCEVL